MAVSVLGLLFTVPWVGLQCVTVAFAGHYHLPLHLCIFCFALFHILLNKSLARINKKMIFV